MPTQNEEYKVPEPGQLTLWTFHVACAMVRPPRPGKANPLQLVLDTLPFDAIAIGVEVIPGVVIALTGTTWIKEATRREAGRLDAFVNNRFGPAYVVVLLRLPLVPVTVDEPVGVSPEVLTVNVLENVGLP